jgi:hypothetical protein
MLGSSMGQNRVFFPQALLDTWIADDRVDLTGEELLLKDEGRKFKISEAVHVLREVAGAGDAPGMVGKVKTRAQLSALNAEILEGSMIIGDDAYDVVPGFIGEPIGSSIPAGAQNEEEMLAQFLMKSL